MDLVRLSAWLHNVAVMLMLCSRKEERETIVGQATTVRHYQGISDRPADDGHTQDAEM